MMTSLDRKLERCAKEIAQQRAAEAAARGPREGLTSTEPDLPDGVWESVDNKGRAIYKATCRACERGYELFGPPEEFSPEYSYCGGSPGCTP